MINMYFLGSQEITDMKDLFEDQEEFSQKGELFEIIGDQLESADCVVNFFNLDVEPQYFTIQDQSGVLVFICDYVNVFESWRIILNYAHLETLFDIIKQSISILKRVIGRADHEQSQILKWHEQLVLELPRRVDLIIKPWSASQRTLWSLW